MQTFLVFDDRIARMKPVKVVAESPRDAAVRYWLRKQLKPRVWIWVWLGRCDWSFVTMKNGQLRETGSGVRA